MNKSDCTRHEFKYPCDEIQMAIIQSRLESLMRRDPHAANGQYTVRSLYFDNYANRCYYENENGTDPREKYRIRIYNASDSRISLECKRKERGKTSKESCPLSREQADMLANGESLSDLSSHPELLRRFLILMKTQMFSPAVIVEYDRIPYVHETGNVRITLDRNLRSSAAFSDFFAETIPSRPVLPPGRHLLEVKYDELLLDYLKEILQLGSLQRTTFSKYYLCRKYTLGGKA